MTHCLNFFFENLGVNDKCRGSELLNTNFQFNESAVISNGPIKIVCLYTVEQRDTSCFHMKHTLAETLQRPLILKLSTLPLLRTSIDGLFRILSNCVNASNQ